MKLRTTILKCKSRFYYYVLLLIGSASMLFFTRCNNPNANNEAERINDSIAKAKHQQDSVAKADSVSRAQREQARLDSIARADSIAKASKPKNPFKPKPVITKYGIPINHPIAEYGVPPNFE